MNNNPEINHTIIDHMDQAMVNVFGIQPDSEFKFTILHDGDKSEVGFRCRNMKLAELALIRAYPGNLQILGCKEIFK